MSKSADRPLPEDDSMLRVYKRVKEAPFLTKLYRIKVLIGEDEHSYTISSWIVERERLQEFFTEYLSEDDEIIEILPFEQGFPRTDSEGGE